MQRSRMLPAPHPLFATALDDAARSPMTADLSRDRPWLRLASFVALATLLMFAMMVAIGLAIAGFPEIQDQLGDMAPLSEGPLRLNDESLQVTLLAAVLGGVAFSILAAAALIWRRRLKDFLWPARRIDVQQFAIGVLVMACVSVIAMPIHLATGSEWAPPIFDPQYLDRTRLTYVVAMTVGLLVAAAAEEVVFRGVLLRLTGLITRRAILLCLINGMLFSAIHLDPDPVAFVARAVSGMVWTWAALRLGGLEFAIGAHLANNLIIALFWAPFSEAASSRESSWTDLGPEILVAVITIVFVERLARRYVDPASLLPSRPTA